MNPNPNRNKVMIDLKYSEMVTELILFFCLMGLLVVSNAFMQETILNGIVGIVNVLFIPGYFLLLVIFPEEGDLSIYERLIIGIILGIAIMSFFALILTYSSLHLNKISVFLFSSILSLILLFLSWIRRLRGSGEPFQLNIAKFINKIRSD